MHICWINEHIHYLNSSHPIILCHFLHFQLQYQISFFLMTYKVMHELRPLFSSISSHTALPSQLDWLSFCFSHMPNLLMPGAICSSWPHCLESPSQVCMGPAPSCLSFWAQAHPAPSQPGSHALPHSPAFRPQHSEPSEITFSEPISIHLLPLL